MGRGGELSVERNDYAPLDLGPVSATDVALLRPPTGVWGYSMQATDEAIEQIAEAIRERDVRIVALEQLVTDLSRDTPPAGAARQPVRQRRPAPADAGAATPTETAAAHDAAADGPAALRRPGRRARPPASCPMLKSPCRPAERKFRRPAGAVP